MKTKVLMIASAVFLGIAGIGLIFMPQEIAGYLNIETNQLTLLILQILGSLYMGFAVLNWMTKNNLIGGIYGKPLITGNMVHFLVSALALIKMVMHVKNQFQFILVLTVIYSAFALGFAYVMMTNPAKLNKAE